MLFPERAGGELLGAVCPKGIDERAGQRDRAAARP
jgi:hypothetical protein